ncbi:hypothetical protein V1J52_03575 [Streptomyces sp. TRM 70351]|uniref:hypothetical protein n=1 Tax=Streptomyces sp. TRM 70351 TaxID=3116552 RepID=UPI002E7AFA54|nr:hypothetical protein [Streptomyces sp. TRM 70351]MEE1927268.1 hypothetical protein [Streptomyces sp. TRM 70351]
MTVVEFETSGVPVRRLLRSLTRAGQVLVHDGRLSLLTSYGREIDSAAVERVRVLRPWTERLAPGRKRTVLSLDGARYTLRLPGAVRERLRTALEEARERAAKIAADQRTVHP